jgi:serine phosphatase RsbU (regulator of sigma subunit)/putative methionine-R-sulfoxide reductase with GAF domain
VLDVQSDKLHAFDTDDVTTLELLGAQLALAIQEAFIYAAERRQSERLNALVEAARAVVSILDINKLLDEVVDLINDHFDYDRVHLFLRQEDQLVFSSGSGVHSERWLMENLSYKFDDPGIIAWCASHAEAAVLQNVHEDERYIIGPGLDDTQSEMTVPIRMGKYVFGVLDIQSPKPAAFRRQDLMLVQGLADTIAIALRNAGLFANEKRRRILAETLREVSTVLASALDLESVLQHILLGMERVVDYNAAIILLLDEEGVSFRVSALNGIEIAEEYWHMSIPADENFEALVDRILYIPNSSPEKPKATTGPLVASDILSVPLSSSENRIGQLIIKRVAGQAFNREEKEIISTFANQAALAIMNAQLYMAQKEEAWISTALLQVAKATGQSTSLDEALRTVAQITLLLAGVEWCAIFLADGEIYRLAQIAGTSEDTANRFENFALRPTTWPPLQDMIDTGFPILMDNTALRPPDLPMPVSVTQAVLLPLFTKGEVLGAMWIGQSTGGDPLTDRKVELLTGIANQAALAIDGAQLYLAQQEEAWVTTVLLQVAEAVNIQYDLDSTLETIVRLMTMLVGVSQCVIYRWDAEEGHFRGLKSAGLSATAELLAESTRIPRDSDPFFQALIETKLPLPAGDGKVYALPRLLVDIFGETTILGIPLIAHNNPVAIMLVDYIDFAGHSGQRRLDILTGVAYQSALAIETARLQAEAIAAQGYEREIQVAREIQHSLLPERAPDIDGWSLSAYYRPARLVGGDFYDFIPLSNGCFALVIADVADKGIPAAMFMTVCRTLIRGVASSQNTPQKTLERVNTLLVRDSRSDLFFTCWFGILNPETGLLVYSSGGHNPPLLVRANGQVEELRVKGMALGIFEPVPLNQGEVILQPEDILVAYTDGLTEAPRKDMVEFGETDLYVNAIKYRHLNAEKIVQKIISAVDRFTQGQPAFDDLTLFILKRNANPDKHTQELAS